MPSFWSYIGNGTYNVGCTGQTVYVYDNAGNELARFKDLIYAYLPVISPRGDSFVVKSVTGRMAVYSLETLSLVKKFRNTKVDPNDGGCCFSPDGSELYSIDCYIDDLKTAISVYDTSDYSLKKRILDQNPDQFLCSIQFEHDEIFLSYYLRGKPKIRYYVANLTGDRIGEAREISQQIFEYYRDYLHLADMGFTQKAKEWSGLRYQGYDLSAIEERRHTLKELWEKGIAREPQER